MSTMKRHGLLMLMAVAAACSPNYESGKTQCSDRKECPSGFSCSDDGTNAVHYCVENKILGCMDKSAFYCSQSRTCWEKAGACSTVTFCGTVKHPGSVICASVGYHPDCNGDVCLPNVGGPDAGGRDSGVGGSGGRSDAGVGGRGATAGTTAKGGSGGSLVLGGASGRGAAGGSGGVYRTGGVTGISGSGGTTVSSTGLCSGTAYLCDSMYNSYDCSLGDGCTWSSSTATCAGTPAACSRYSSSGALCSYNGCTWSGTTSCPTTAVTSFCQNRVNGSADYCEMCLFTSCCAAATTCYNDVDCYGDTPNANFFAMYTCAFNCCASVCL